MQAKGGLALVEKKDKLSDDDQASHDFLEKLKSYGQQSKPTYALSGLHSLAETQK